MIGIPIKLAIHPDKAFKKLMTYILYIVMVVDDCLFIFKFELFVFGGAILMVSVGDPPMRFHKGFSEFPVLDFQVLIMNSWNS